MPHRTLSEAEMFGTELSQGVHHLILGPNLRYPPRAPQGPLLSAGFIHFGAGIHGKPWETQ